MTRHERGSGAAAAAGTDRRADGHHSGEDDRRAKVLTQAHASVVRTIADALVVKDGPLFLVTEADGSIPLHQAHGFGLYFHDCRYVGGYEVRVADRELLMLARTDAEGYRSIIQLSNGELSDVDGRTVPKDTIGARWTRLIDAEAVAVRDELRLSNYGQEAVTVPVSLSFECRFEDVFAIRGLLQRHPGSLREPRWDGDRTLVFAYDGADERHREVVITFDPLPQERGRTSATFIASLEPGATWALSVSLSLAERLVSATADTTQHRSARPADEARRLGRRLTRACVEWRRSRTMIRSDNPVLDRLVDRSILDLRILRTSSGAEAPSYFAAGVPWFVTLFGRDSLITALQILAFDRDVAAETLRLLASRQGRRVSSWNDEEPGKILHELRIGELARLGEIPHTPYYGTVDATPLFLILLAAHARWTGSLDLFRELRDNVARALAWIDEHGDQDGDGFVEYRSNVERGLINQGWKDSGNAIVDEDGGLAEPPIALAEVQAYVFRAKREVADLYERDGEGATAERLRGEADELRNRFDRAFWLPDLGFHAMALGAGGRPTRVVASNPGHALWAGMLDRDRAAAVCARLMEPDMFAGWGIRTLSAREVAYNPVGYHLGTIWPHDNAIIGTGLREYGFNDEAHAIFDGLVEAAMSFDGYRLPEALAGFSRDEFERPVRYPVACHPQAWAAGSIPMLLTALLGLEPDAFERRLGVVRPALPSFVDRLDLRRVRVGEASADLRFERHGDELSVDVTRVDGDLDVRIETAPLPRAARREGGRGGRRMPGNGSSSRAARR